MSFFSKLLPNLPFLDLSSRPNIQYFQYVWRHKAAVYKAGRKLGLSPIRLLLHDASKLTPLEWTAYRNYFYARIDKATDSTESRTQDTRFALAWNQHQKRNRHHWQYYVLYKDSGEPEVLEMAWEDMLEMVADWKGAGEAQGKNKPSDLPLWYENNKDRILLHPVTRNWVELIVHKFHWDSGTYGPESEKRSDFVVFPEDIDRAMTGMDLATLTSNTARP
jgi:hypothetical protein